MLLLERSGATTIQQGAGPQSDGRPLPLACSALDDDQLLCLADPSGPSRVIFWLDSPVGGRGEGTFQTCESGVSVDACLTRLLSSPDGSAEIQIASDGSALGPVVAPGRGATPDPEPTVEPVASDPEPRPAVEGPAAPETVDDVDCNSFGSQPEAQTFFDANGPDDRFGLDEDNDFIACEEPSSPFGQPAVEPPTPVEMPAGPRPGEPGFVDRNCTDFANQAAAQAFFDSQGPGDPHRLDADGNGLACESLP